MLNLQNYQTVKANNNKRKEQQQDEYNLQINANLQYGIRAQKNQDVPKNTTNQRHVSKSPNAIHQNYLSQSTNQIFTDYQSTQNSNNHFNSSIYSNKQQNKQIKGNSQQQVYHVHHRSLSPSLVNSNLAQPNYQQQPLIYDQSNFNNLEHNKAYNQRRGMVQSMDFNYQGGIQNIMQDNNFEKKKQQIKLQQRDLMQRGKRDLSPIWGPQNQNLDIYQNYLEPAIDEQCQNMDINEIIVTESDVSHQSSFYDIPDERKEKLHNPKVKYQQPVQINHYENQNHNNFNSLLEQFQFTQQKQVSNQKISPRFQQTSTKNINQRKQLQQVNEKKQQQDKQAIIDYSRYREVPIKSSLNSNRSHQSFEKESKQQLISESEKSERLNQFLHSQNSDQNQNLTKRHHTDNLIIPNNLSLRNKNDDTLILSKALLQQKEDNIKLQTEIEAFKLFSQALLRQNKELKMKQRLQQQKIKNQELFIAKIKQLERENNSLKIKNYQIIDKFQSLVSSIKEQFNQNEEQEDEYDLLEELYKENKNLRSLLQINNDMESIKEIDDQLKSQESLVSTEESPPQLSESVKSLIENAKKNAEEKSKKKKDEFVSNANSTDKGDKYAYKNIKPKKAFLLLDDNKSESTCLDDTADDNVNLESPEHS